MKKFLLAALAAVTLFASCSKEGGEGQADIDAASITIKFSNSTTKALDDLNGSDFTQTILVVDNANVFMFDNLGNMLLQDYMTTNQLAGGKTYDNATYGITTAVAEVVVVGNAGDLTTTNLTDKATLNAEIGSLVSAETLYANNTGNFWVYGTSAITWTGTNSGVTEGEAELEINPILSRIDVTVDISGVTAGLDGAEPNVVLDGVAVLYSASWSHYIPKFAPTAAEVTAAGGGKVLTSGVIAADYPLWDGLPVHGDADQFGTKGAETILNGVWATNYVVGDKKYTRSFYAFAPDIANYGSNAIVTVYGHHQKWEGGAVTKTTPLFWPVHFSDNESATGAEPLEPGNVYSVAISFTKDFSDGGGGGTDPEQPINAANILVKVKPAKWKTVINISKEFEGK